MLIRDSRPGDQAALMRLAHELHPEHGLRALKPVRLESRTFAAEADDEVIGFALVTLTDYGLESCGYIEELVVEESNRGDGIGTALLQRCVDWLKENDVFVLFLSSRDDMSDRFYLARGFERCKRPWLVRLVAPKS